MGPAMKRMPLPPDRREVLAAEFRKNDPRVNRRMIHRYFQYLDRYGSVAPRLCAADVPAWVVHGERGDGGVTDQERRTLEACPQIRVITIPGASYFTPNEEPALVAKLIAEALGESAVTRTNSEVSPATAEDITLSDPAGCQDSKSDSNDTAQRLT
jgi:pimeloyl-ACP methyl ester carboxylesterase